MPGAGHGAATCKKVASEHAPGDFRHRIRHYGVRRPAPMKLVPPCSDTGMPTDDVESSGSKPAVEQAHANDAGATGAREPGADRPTWDGIDLTDLIKLLTLYADELLRRYRWRGNAASGAPGAKTAEDFVQEAFLKYFNGERRR